MKYYIQRDSLNALDMDSFKNEMEHLKEHIEVIYPYVKEIVENKVFPHRYGNKFRVELPDEEHVYVIFSLSRDQTYLKNMLCFLKPVEYFLETPNVGHDIEQYGDEWDLVMMEITNNLDHYNIYFESEVRSPRERTIEEI